MSITHFRSLACALFIAVTVSCGGSSSNRVDRANANAEEGQPAIAVTVGKSELRDVASTIEATGSLLANETSDVAPKVAGKISNISIDVGDFVGGGSVIARIDDRDARLTLSSAQTGVKQAEAAVRQAEARLGLGRNGKFNASTVPEVRTANAVYEQILAELKQAEANEARYRELIESGDVAMVTYEQFRTGRDTARAKANAARELLETAVNNAKQSNQAIVSAQVGVEAAQARVNEAQQALADTIIKAPFAGFVSARPVAVGEFVSSASIVATLLRTNPIKIQIQVAEADLPFVSVGSGVSLEVDAYKDRRFAGTVSAVNPALDPASRSAMVEALVENGDNALRAGMFATARINREGGTLKVYAPKAAVFNDQATNSFRVFAIVDGIAKLKVVQLGREEGDAHQILSGLEADQTVATSGLDQLYEGARVVF